ncbi:MAG: cell wall-active antibiotics response protein [Tannerella sp.]|jgi:predicted membrane protein|nr:cell wall-active antibiotics response protein [Tannerella sp.]
MKTKFFTATVFVAMMIGGGILCVKTVNEFYPTSSAIITLALAMLSVFLYVAGATLISNCVGRKQSEYVTFRYHGGSNDGVLFALMGIGAGFLLLGFNTGYLNPVWKEYFFSWYMLLLAGGVICIFRLHIVTGIAMAAIGKFFLFDKTAALFPDDEMFSEFTGTYWPVLIIVLGVLILLSIILRPFRYGKSRYKCFRNDNVAAHEVENKDGKINYRFVFSGGEQVVLDPVFRGGTVEVIGGGMMLDLRRTTLDEGETHLNITVNAGGVQIFAPDSWEIEFRSKALFAGVYDSRDKGTPKDKSRKLVIFADCKFGGIDIDKNY